MPCRDGKAIEPEKTRFVLSLNQGTLVLIRPCRFGVALFTKTDFLVQPGSRLAVDATEQIEHPSFDTFAGLVSLALFAVQAVALESSTGFSLTQMRAQFVALALKFRDLAEQRVGFIGFHKLDDQASGITKRNANGGHSTLLLLRALDG